MAGEVVGGGAGPERGYHPLLLLGEVMKGEELPVRRDRGIEADCARRPADRRGAILVHRAQRGDHDVQLLPRPAGQGEAGLQLGQ